MTDAAADTFVEVILSSSASESLVDNLVYGLDRSSNARLSSF